MVAVGSKIDVDSNANSVDLKVWIVDLNVHYVGSYVHFGLKADFDCILKATECWQAYKY